MHVVYYYILIIKQAKQKMFYEKNRKEAKIQLAIFIEARV